MDNPNNRRVGLEIEVANLGTTTARLWLQNHQIVESIGTDSSIRPLGAEIRLLPLLPNMAYKTACVKLLRRIREIPEARVNNTCGLHVHVDFNRTNHAYYFGQRRYWLLSKTIIRHYFENNPKEFQKFVPFDKRRVYCDPDFKSVRGERYSAVNLLSRHNTLEIRMFNAHLSSRWLFMAIRFAIGITDYLDGELKKLVV